MKAALLTFSSTSLCFNDLPPTLDGVLAGIEYQQSYDVEKANAVPEIMKNSFGVPMASRAILIGETEITSDTIYRAPTAVFRRSPQSVGAISSPPRSFGSFIKTEVGKTSSSKYDVYHLNGVGFVFVGDADAVVKKIMQSPHIGTNRKSHGGLSDPRIEILDIPINDETCIVSNDRLLLRPIPASMKIQPTNHAARDGYWKTPYTPIFARQAGIEPTLTLDMPHHCSVARAHDIREMVL